MGYCRFENTARDLGDCLDAIENDKHKDLSRDELRGLEDLLGSCNEIYHMKEEIEDEIENQIKIK